MTFIETAPDAEGTNYERVFSLRPEVYAAWEQLRAAVTANMDARRYELATIAAARRIRSSYCLLAHGSVLLEGHLEPDELRAVAVDHRSAGLDAVDVAVMDLADKVAADASSVTQADVDRLRELGLSDAEIFDVVLAASLRCFFAKAVEGVGAQPDARFNALEPGLRDALVVGRPIASA